MPGPEGHKEVAGRLDGRGGQAGQQGGGLGSAGGHQVLPLLLVQYGEIRYFVTKNNWIR